MSGRAIWIGLAVSLALNLFIGGALIGALVQHARQPAPPPPPRAEVVEIPSPAPAVAPAPTPAPVPIRAAPSPAAVPAPVRTVEPSPTPVGPPPQPGPQPGGGNPLLRAGDNLPPQIRGPYRAALRDAAEESKVKLAAARRAHMEVARLMAQPNFDPAALTAALDRARAAEADARSDVEGAMVRFASGMSLPERRLLANGLRENQQGGRPGANGPPGPQGFGQGFGPGRGGPAGSGRGDRGGRGGRGGFAPNGPAPQDGPQN